MVGPVFYRSGESKFVDAVHKKKVEDRYSFVRDAIFSGLEAEWKKSLEKVEIKLGERNFSRSQGIKFIGAIGGLAFAIFVANKPIEESFSTRWSLFSLRVSLLYLPVHASVVICTKYRKILERCHNIILDEEKTKYKFTKVFDIGVWWNFFIQISKISFPFITYNYKFWKPTKQKNKKLNLGKTKENYDLIQQHTSPLFQRFKLIICELADIAERTSLQNYEVFNEEVARFMKHSTLFVEDRNFLQSHTKEIYLCLLSKKSGELAERLFESYLMIYDKNMTLKSHLDKTKSIIKPLIKVDDFENEIKSSLKEKVKTEWENPETKIRVTLDDNQFLAVSLGLYDEEKKLAILEPGESERLLSKLINKEPIERGDGLIDLIPRLLNNENIDLIEYCFNSFGMKFFRKSGDKMIGESLSLAAKTGNIHLIKRFIAEIDSRSKKITEESIPELTKGRLSELDEYLDELRDAEKDQARFAKVHVLTAIAGDTAVVNALRKKSGIAKNKEGNVLVEELIWAIENGEDKLVEDLLKLGVEENKRLFFSTLNFSKFIKIIDSETLSDDDTALLSWIFEKEIGRNPIPKNFEDRKKILSKYDLEKCALTRLRKIKSRDQLEIKLRKFGVDLDSNPVPFFNTVTLNSMGRSGKTPLMHSLNAKEEIFNLVSGNDEVNIRVRDKKGFSCIDYAVFLDNHDYLDSLLTRYVSMGSEEDVKIAHYYASKNSLPLNKFKNKFPDLFQKDSKKETLIVAAKVGCFDAVIRIIESDSVEENNIINAINSMDKTYNKIVSYLLLKRKKRSFDKPKADVRMAVNTRNLLSVIDQVETSLKIEIDDYINSLVVAMDNKQDNIVQYLMFNQSHTDQHEITEDNGRIEVKYLPFQNDRKKKSDLFNSTIQNGYLHYFFYLLNNDDYEFRNYKAAMLAATSFGELTLLRILKQKLDSEVDQSKVPISKDEEEEQGSGAVSNIKNGLKQFGSYVAAKVNAFEKSSREELESASNEVSLENKKEERNKLLTTCLETAVQKKQKKVVEYLLSQKIVEATDTIINMAIKSKCYIIAELITQELVLRHDLKNYLFNNMKKNELIKEFISRGFVA